jgi:hypothetical protein
MKPYEKLQSRVNTVYEINEAMTFENAKLTVFGRNSEEPRGFLSRKSSQTANMKRNSTKRSLDKLS